MLLENAVDLDLIGPGLTIVVQDANPSATAASAWGTGGVYTNFSARINLQGVNSSFVSAPDAVLAHEYGHVWGEYHRYLSQNGDWSAWLQFRGLTTDERVDSSYVWSKMEIFAEDYRLLFSSPTALSQWSGPMNTSLPDARDVPGYAGFMLGTWAG
jgi:hypothetical protein